MSKLKPVAGADALWAFCLDEFYLLAKRWEKPEDLDKLLIRFSSNGYPYMGEHTLKLLFKAAVFPDKIGDSEWGVLLVTCYKVAPDFVIALLARIRTVFGKASAHRRVILLSSDIQSPKRINPRPKELEAVSKEYQRRRGRSAAASSAKQSSLESVWDDSIEWKSAGRDLKTGTYRGWAIIRRSTPSRLGTGRK